MISVMIQFIIELLGTLFIAWLIFGLLNIYGVDIMAMIRHKYTSSSHRHTADVKQQVKSVIRLKEEMKLLLSNRQQKRGQALQSMEKLESANIELMKPMGERFLGMCDLLVRELTAFHAMSEQKPSTEENKSPVVEILEAEIEHLKEVISLSEAESKEIYDVNCKTIEKIRESLDGKLLDLRNEYLDKIVKLEIGLQELYNHQAELEIGFVSKFGHELEVLRHQQEDDLSDVHPTVFLWKISGFQNKLQALMQEDSINIVSLDYFNVANGLQVKPILRINAARENVVVNLEFVDDLPMRQNVPPFLHFRKYVLLDQSSDLVKENVELVDRPYFGMNTAVATMLEHFNCLLLCSIDLLNAEGKYQKNDEILIKVVLEPLALVCQHLASNNGVLLWKIEGYSKRKREEIEESKPRLISEPFRTSKTGYNAQIELFLNGSAGVEGEYMSIFVQFLLGEHDSFLPCPFGSKVSFFLMDQSESEPKINVSAVHECCQFSETMLDCGFSEFVPLHLVADPKYLKNDSILIRTAIDIL